MGKLGDYLTSLTAATNGLEQRRCMLTLFRHRMTPQVAHFMSEYNDDLQTFAYETDILKPPAAVKAPHQQIVQATVDIWGTRCFTSLVPGICTHPPSQREIDQAVNQARAMTSWNTACHKLYDTASAEKIDVDCATALHQKESPGI